MWIGTHSLLLTYLLTHSPTHSLIRVFKHVQRSQISAQLSKTIEKLIVFAALASLLCPGVRLEDQVKELVDKGPTHAPGSFRGNDSAENKVWTEKLRRINDGDIIAYTELFENNCPKFIYPGTHSLT